LNLPILYHILASISGQRELLTYGDLSRAYHDATGEWHEPHRSWDQPLGQLNTQLCEAGWPPLSAVVVLQSPDGAFGEPGAGFWQSSPNVPARPANPTDRTVMWAGLLEQVHRSQWPATLPNGQDR
jgi:hypothetical protein